MVIKNYTSIITGEKSDNGKVKDRESFNGVLKTVKWDKTDKYFYRYRLRELELIADHSTEYSIGVEDHIIKDLQEKEIPKIHIETNVDHWHISLNDFVKYSTNHSGIKNLLCCPTFYFNRNEKVIRKKQNKEVNVNEEKNEKKKVSFGEQGNLF